MNTIKLRPSAQARVKRQERTTVIGTITASALFIGGLWVVLTVFIIATGGSL
jgi:hypothetical protein